MLKKEKGQAVPAHRHLTHQGPETQKQSTIVPGWAVGSAGASGLVVASSHEEGVTSSPHHPRVHSIKDVEAPPTGGCPSSHAAGRLPGETQVVSASALAPLWLPLGPVKAPRRSRATRMCREKGVFLRNWLTRPWGLASQKPTGQAGDPGQG